jgi:hypothetical protein
MPQEANPIVDLDFGIAAVAIAVGHLWKSSAYPGEA